ncbi:hypothetical protein T08_7117 [Trichinella sp. T8]|nr:hypothetical protein T08_7117 [Trichinella sp. T8]
MECKESAYRRFANLPSTAVLVDELFSSASSPKSERKEKQKKSRTCVCKKQFCNNSHHRNRLSRRKNNHCIFKANFSTVIYSTVLGRSILMEITCTEI